jgi:hypothetical protein
MTKSNVQETPRQKAIREAQNAWRDAQQAAYPLERDANWCYNGSEIAAFERLLAGNELTLEDVGVQREQVEISRRTGYLNAARECLRLYFKNDSAVSPAARLVKMDQHLAAAGKTRADIGLFDDAKDLLTQVPDLQMALMNPGRRYVHHLWQPGLVQPLTVFDYNPETQTFRPRAKR